MDNFKDLEHFNKHMKETPLCFMPSDTRHIVCDSGETVIYSPFNVSVEYTDPDKDGNVEVVKIVTKNI